MSKIVDRNQAEYLGTDELNNPDKVPVATTNYFASLAGLPFRRDVKCRPDGVLWIGFRRKGEKEPPTLWGDLERRISSKLVELEAVLGVCATLYSIYQFLDPDEALNSLPFRKNS
jgi:hypothetical protein